MKTIFNTLTFFFFTSLIASAQDWKPDTIWVNENGNFAGASYSFDDESECFPMVGMQIDGKGGLISFAMQLNETVVWIDAAGKAASVAVEGFSFERNAFNSIGRVRDVNDRILYDFKYKNQKLYSIKDSIGHGPLAFHLDVEFNIDGMAGAEGPFILSIKRDGKRIAGLGNTDKYDLYSFTYENGDLVAILEKAQEKAVKIKYTDADGKAIADKISGSLESTVVVIGTPVARIKASK